MRISGRSLSHMLVLLLVLLLAGGCVQGLALVTATPTAVQVGVMAYDSIEEADIDIVLTDDRERLKDIECVAIFMGQENTSSPYGRIGNIGAVFGDNLSMRLMTSGLRVCRWADIEKHIKKNPKNGTLAIADMVSTGKNLGAQAILTGHVTAGYARSLGMLGIGSMATVVQSVSLKIIDTDNAETAMIITINYKKGQKPGIAAEGVAMVLKAKIENPYVDLKKVLEEKRKEAG